MAHLDHLLVDGAMGVSAAHDFAEDVDPAIERAPGATEAFVHVEPA